MAPRSICLLLISAVALARGDTRDCDPCRKDKLWVDLIYIIDTSAAMGQDGLQQVYDFLFDPLTVVTLPDVATDAYFSRVGLIYDAADATIIYDLNLTSTDDFWDAVPAPADTDDLNLEAGFATATDMFERHSTSSRANARQVIVLAASSYSDFDHHGLDQFKVRGGILIVYQYVQEGQTEDDRLKALTDPQYFFSSNTGPPVMLDVFCDLSCYCTANLTTYYNPATGQRDASKGCYHVVAGAPVSYGGANHTCAAENAFLATIHDSEKNSFVYNLISNHTSTIPYWIGYTYSTPVQSWAWADGNNTSSYNAWAPGQPQYSTDAYAKKSGFTLAWYSATSSSNAYNYICQLYACSTNNYC